jgi:CubicO group peptidase (beta-lactamase class C family)
MRRWLGALAVAVLLTAPASAHNTRVAVAPALDGIVVDGDLSDWPADLPVYAVNGQTAVSDPQDAADLTATYRVAWDEAAQALFVAIEAADESIVVIDTATAWNASDGSEVFLDLRHRERGSPTVQHVLYGRHHTVYGSGADSAGAAFGTYAVTRDSTEGGGLHRYEWRFDLAGISRGQVRAAAGMVLGLDVVVADRDEDGSFTWMAWGPGIGKSGNAHRLGDVVLLSSLESAAHLTGQVRWKKKGQGVPPRRVRLDVEGEDGERYGAVAAVDAQGTYRLTVAPGTYRVRPMDLRIRTDRDVSRKVRVQAGQSLAVKQLKVPVEKQASRLVDQLFDDIEPGQPGAAVLVARGDEVLHLGTYGLANVELGVPVTPKTKFRIASVSKQFTTAAVLLLAEEGRLDIDAPLSTYLPEYPHADSITTRQMMAHVSGIPNYLSMSEFWAEAALGRDMAGLLDVFQRQDLAFEPGSRYSYSNSGYVVLAHLLEEVSGQRYGEFLQQRIFDPLGMADSGVDHYRPLVANRASGYSISQGELANTSWLDMYLLTGAGNIYSTVGDLHRWARSLDEATLLRRETIDAMSTRFTLTDGNEIDYGLGFRIADDRGLRVVGHSGSINGFTSQFSRIPVQEMTIVVLDNSPYIAPGEKAAQIAEIYLADEMEWELAEAE